MSSCGTKIFDKLRQFDHEMQLKRKQLRDLRDKKENLQGLVGEAKFNLSEDKAKLHEYNTSALLASVDVMMEVKCLLLHSAKCQSA
jgi:hypothetical protein